MFKKRSKKALSHVDWAMSLAIFLLYLAWFFIFVKPLLAPSQTMNTLLDILDEGVTDVLFQDVERVRMFMPGEFDNDYEPIIIPFSRTWKTSDIAHSEEYFVIDAGRMFFLGNVSKSREFRMYYPHRALITKTPRTIIASEDRAWVGSFSAYFSSYLLDRIQFFGKDRLRDFAVDVDERDIQEEGEMDNFTMMAKYSRMDEALNISSYVLAENSRVYSYISSADYRNHSVIIDFTAYNYTRFYFNPSDQGTLSYSIRPSCKYYKSDFLDLSDTDSGMLITFDEDIDMRLCTNETDVQVRLEFDLTTAGDSNLDIFLHEGGVEDMLDYPVEPRVGITETLDTVSSKQVALMRGKDYGYLKQLFNYPDDRDFNVTVESVVINATYGRPHPEVADIYARKVDGYILGEEYGTERVLITLSVW
ncbi:MAG: hypothetical protein V1729_02080 [Candidatus Woesearchaeota archaeon]